MAKLIQKTTVEYIRSVLFIVFLVSGMKFAQCTSTQVGVPFLSISVVI